MTALEGIWNVASRPAGMRLLIAFEEQYRAYGGAISSAIRALRPGIEVESTGTDAIPQELARFAPQAVISSSPEGPDEGGRVAWIELPPEPDETAHARLGDRRFALENPSLDTMIELIDEAKRLI